jgi:hypothetical protein
MCVWERFCSCLGVVGADGVRRLLQSHEVEQEGIFVVEIAESTDFFET